MRYINGIVQLNRIELDKLLTRCYILFITPVYNKKGRGYERESIFYSD